MDEVNAARDGVAPRAEPVDPVIVGLPAIGDKPAEESLPDPDLARHVVVPPARLRSVPPPGSSVPESIAPPVNGNGRSQPRQPSRSRRPPGAARERRTHHLDCGAMFDSIDHVGVAVDDLEAAVALYSDTLGMPIQHRETVEEQGVEAVLLGVGESHVELLSPLGDETPVGRFLAKKGPGMHHTAYRCADVAGAIEQCRSRGLRMIDEQSAAGYPGQPGRVRASGLHGRSPDRAGAAGRRSALMARDSGEVRRVEVGFSGGQVILMRLPEKSYEQLRRAVQDGRNWYDVETADGVVAVNLAQVVFVKLESSEHRVGFSGL